MWKRDLGTGGGGGFSSGSSQLFLISGCLLLQLLIPPAYSFERNAQCAQVGQTDRNGRVFTIGGQAFQVRNGEILGESFQIDPVYVSEFLAYLQYPFQHYREKKWSTVKLSCKEDPYELDSVFTRVALHSQYVDWCPKDVEIRAYLVKEGADKVLRGWLHIEVELVDRDPVTGKVPDEMEYAYVQVRDQDFNVIGEIVTKPSEVCNRADSVSPTRHQALPCSAIGATEPKASQAVFIAKHSQYLKKPSDNQITKDDLKKKVHFTWRLNEYWCNRHEKIRIDATVWTSSAAKNMSGVSPGMWRYSTATACGTHFDKCRAKRKVSDFWLHPKWYGAADIKDIKVKNKADLDCSTRVIEGGTLTKDAKSWIREVTKTNITEDYVAPSRAKIRGIKQIPLYVSYGVCQVNPSAGFRDAISFGGRCEVEAMRVTKTNHSALQKCSQKPSSPETSSFQTYSAYAASLKAARLKQCTQTCEIPDFTNPKHLEEIQAFADGDKYDKENGTGNTTVSIRKRTQPVNLEGFIKAQLESRAFNFWATRKYHGNLCILVTMFIIPVTNFMTRYFKETFMTTLALGCSPWFWCHMFSCFAVPALYRASYAGIQLEMENFGRSLSHDAEFHRFWGYVFIYGYLAMICLGGFRPIQLRNRVLTMALHAVVGFVLYIIALILIYNSSYIPGSPSLDVCDTEGKLPIGFSYVAWMSVVWGCVDAAFHLGLTVVQFKVDTVYKIERAGFGLPFIPVLPADQNFRRDLTGFRFRKAVLGMYIAASALATVATMTELYQKDNPGNCTLGKLSCDLSQTMPGMSSSPFGCSKAALSYYAKVYEKYQVNLTGIYVGDVDNDIEIITSGKDDEDDYDDLY